MLLCRSQSTTNSYPHSRLRGVKRMYKHIEARIWSHVRSPMLRSRNSERAYGQESKYTNEIREWEWQADDFNLQVWGDSDPKRVRSIGLDVRPGHIITTPDGIDLRKDTFATLLQKMRDRGISVSEKMEGADGTWILFASFPSLCNADDWSEYSWYLNGTPAVDDAVGNSYSLPLEYLFAGRVRWRITSWV